MGPVQSVSPQSNTLNPGAISSEPNEISDEASGSTQAVPAQNDAAGGRPYIAPLSGAMKPASVMRAAFDIRPGADLVVDLNANFQSAVLRNDEAAARKYLDGGAETLPAMRHFISSGDWPALAWMMKSELVRGPEALTVLKEVQEAQNKLALETLVYSKHVLGVLATMKDEPPKVKADTLTQFVEAGSTAAALVMQAAERLAVPNPASEAHDKQILEILFLKGAPAFFGLVDQAQKRHSASVNFMVKIMFDMQLAGLDIAYKYLGERHDFQAVEVVDYALLLAMLGRPSHDDTWLKDLRVYVGMMRVASEAILREKALAAAVYETEVLVSVGAPTAGLLVEFALAGNLQAAALIIKGGADAFGAIAHLRIQSERYRAEGDREAAENAQRAADELESLMTA